MRPDVYTQLIIDHVARRNAAVLTSDATKRRLRPKPQGRKRKTSLKLGALCSVAPKRATQKILAAIGSTGSVRGAALKLKVSTTVLYSYLKKLGIEHKSLCVRQNWRVRFRLPPRRPEMSEHITPAANPMATPNTGTTQGQPGTIAHIRGPTS